MYTQSKNNQSACLAAGQKLKENGYHNIAERKLGRGQCRTPKISSTPEKRNSSLPGRAQIELETFQTEVSQRLI
jgi:hypothetical protein